MANSDCAACSDGKVCSAGYCATDREVSPQYKLAADCKSTSLHCSDGACAQ